jgi:hypothetical protein
MDSIRIDTMIQKEYQSAAGGTRWARAASAGFGRGVTTEGAEQCVKLSPCVYTFSLRTSSCASSTGA